VPVNDAGQLGVPIDHAAAAIPATRPLAGWLLVLSISLFAAVVIARRT
jgi:hypothetical protein